MLNYLIFIILSVFIPLSFQCPPKEDVLALTSNQSNTKNFWVNKSYKWPKGVIPIIISSQYSKKDLDIVRWAINHWEKNTCVRFVNRTNQKDYAEITPNDGTKNYCYCHVGRIGGKQVMKMYGECMRQGSMVHEFGHLVGFQHEHQRPDRDDFVNINLKNVDRTYHYAFDKFTYKQVDNLGQAYDYKSVMQYPYHAFTSSTDPSKASITLKDGSIGPIRNEAKVLSKGDIKKTSVYYNNCK